VAAVQLGSGHGHPQALDTAYAQHIGQLHVKGRPVSSCFETLGTSEFDLPDRSS